MTNGLKVTLIAAGAGAAGGLSSLGYVLTRPKNLKEDLERGTHKVLNTEEKVDDNIWKILAQKYATKTTLPNIKRITNLEFQNPVASSADPHPGIQKLKDECKNLFKKIKSDKDYETFKENAENWCTDKNSKD